MPPEPITFIDTLVLWTSKAECLNSQLSAQCLRTATTEGNIRNLINLAIQETNVAFALSGVNAELNLVHAEWLNYAEANAYSALEHITQSKSVADLRFKYCADIVVLITDYCGIAHLGPHKDKMFSVTHWSCATGHYTFGHEIGHNFVSLVFVSLILSHFQPVSLSCSH